MVFSAVLDANVLSPFSLRDTLLRLAELELYTPLWSERILEEMRRNLIERQISEDQADRLIAAMRRAFEEAEVDAPERLEPAMTNEPNDRHVLAGRLPRRRMRAARRRRDPPRRLPARPPRPQSTGRPGRT